MKVWEEVKEGRMDREGKMDRRRQDQDGVKGRKKERRKKKREGTKKRRRKEQGKVEVKVRGVEIEEISMLG